MSIIEICERKREGANEKEISLRILLLKIKNKIKFSCLHVGLNIKKIFYINF